MSSVTGTPFMSKEDYRKAKIRESYVNKHIKQKIAKHYQVKGYKNICQRIINNVGNRTDKSYKKYGVKRILSIRDLIGCTNQELIKHLENNFMEGMTIGNYGDWEVDHIKPIASYDIRELSQRLECFNYKNLQPLWKEDNNKKSDKTTGQIGQSK